MLRRQVKTVPNSSCRTFQANPKLSENYITSRSGEEDPNGQDGQKHFAPDGRPHVWSALQRSRLVLLGNWLLPAAKCSSVSL